MAAPQVVVSVSVGEMAANYQGVYSSDTAYVKGQWVTYEEGLWACVKNGTDETPVEGSVYWRLIGAVPKEAE